MSIIEKLGSELLNSERLGEERDEFKVMLAMKFGQHSFLEFLD